jgi:hypothetical protein
MSYIQQFFTSRDNNANSETFVGQVGRLWWDPETNQIYSSDGETPGGVPLSGGGGGSGTVTQVNTGTGTLTVNAPTGTPYDGQKLLFRIQSTNSLTFVFNAIFIGSTDLAPPTVTSGGSKYDYMGWMYNSGDTKWNLISRNFGFV